MSSRNQHATKRQTKSNSKSSEKSKNEEVKSKEEQDNITSKLRTANKSQAKQNEKFKIAKKVTSSKQFQSDRSTSKSPSSIPSSNVKNTSTSALNKKQGSNASVANRIQKTQFFPTKQMYTKVMKAAQGSSKDTERNQTKTSSPKEIKMLNKETNNTSPQSLVNRPRTATIKKAPPVEPAPEDYEDDFDSYESDFEEYNSSSKTSETISETSSSLEEDDDKELGTKLTEIYEEHKLDSGNFELPELKHTQVLDRIKENETETTYVEPNRSNFTSLSDEGFEDCKIDKSGQFINFLEAQQKQNHLKSLTVKRKRGEELASMIKLDIQAFTIFELESTPYNLFIRKFGNNNTVQISTQTGDDNIAIETQTHETETVNKWTQYPVELSEIKKTNINLSIYKQENLGVGSDCIQPDLDEVKYNEHSLKHFLECVGDVILSLIDENAQQRNCKEIDINSNHIPFSEGYISFNTRYSHLENMPIIYANFSHCATKLITIHTGTLCSFLCIWRISNPNMPEYCVKVHGTVTSCAFLGLHVYGGLNDGSVAIWNLQEQCAYVSQNVTAPSYITNIDTGHTSKIVSIELFESDENIAADGRCNSQVYSLDEDGYLIIWTVIILESIIMKQITLQQSLKYSCKKLYPNLHNLQCTNMAVNRLDVNHIFISTNYGEILHLVTATGTKANPTKYSAGWTVQSNCVTTCPFSPMYTLSAYENGKIVLFSRNTEVPLITLTNCDDATGENGVEFIEWSKNKPCVFYAKDRKNCIHIWNLSISDIFPVCSIPFKEEINFIKLSPSVTKEENMKRSYIVIVSNTFNVNLHVLNKDHGQQDPSEYESNVKKFLNYVNRL